MSFLQDARRSAKSLLAHSVFAVLSKASAQALESRIRLRMHHDHTNVDITKQDVQAAYKVASRVASRWVDELKKIHEEEAASIVERVSLYGKFLEETDIDDSFLEDKVVTKNNKVGPNLIMHDQGITKESDCVTSRCIKDFAGDLERQKDFIMISQKFGCKDPCQVEHESESLSSSTKWHPLPIESHEATSYSPLHNPELNKLSTSQILSIPKNQLYGYPSDSLTLDLRKPFASFLRQNNVLYEEFVKLQIEMLNEFGSSNKTLWVGEWDIMTRAATLLRKRNHLLPHSPKQPHPPLSLQPP